MVHGKEEGTTCACILILIHFPSCFNVCLSLRSTAAPVLAASHARRKHPSTLRNPPNWRCIQSFIWSRHVYRLPSNGADLRALWVWALKQGAANMKLHTYLIFRRSSLFTSYPCVVLLLASCRWPLALRPRNLSFHLQHSSSGRSSVSQPLI